MTSSFNFSSKVTIALLIIAVAIFEGATDIFLPILPTLQEFFGRSPQTTQWVLSIYLFGFSFFGVLVGPLSDQLGRRWFIFLGVFLFWLGSLSSYLVAEHSIYALITARFVQGIGAGISTALVVAIVRDLFDVTWSAKILSLMGMVIATAPMVAPLLGISIAQASHWTHIFLLMVGLATFLLFGIGIYGKESLQHKKAFDAKGLIKNCRAIFRNKACFSMMVISSLMYGCLFAWLIQAPFFFADAFDIRDGEYALYAALGPLFYIIGSWFNYYFLAKGNILRLIWIGLLIGVWGVALLLLATLLNSQYVWFYIISFLVFNTGIAFVFSNGSAKAVDLAGSKRGTASSVLSSMEQLFAAIASSCVGIWGPKTIMPVLLCMIVSFGVSFWLMKTYIFRKKSKPLTHC